MSEKKRRLPWRAAVIAAIATFSVLAGTMGSYAYWTNTGTSAGLSFGAATLSTTATGWTATTLANETTSGASSQSLTSSTGSVTITNTTTTTSTSSQTLTAIFGYQAGSTTLANNTTLRVWPVTSATLCTSSATPSGGASGTWGAGVSVTTTLAPGGAGVQVYCLRNTVADRQNVADSSGTLSFTPQLYARLSAGDNFQGGATVASTISTQYIYPLSSITAAYWYNVVRAPNWCLDLSGAGTTSGTLLISYGCKNNTDTNQDFRFLDADGDGYMDIQPRNATGLRIAAASSTTSGSAVDVRTAAATTPVQEWQPQSVGGGYYQYVNQYSGLCLNAPAASTANVSQVACNGSDDQKFTLVKRAVIQLTSFDCSPTGTGNNRSGTLTWAADYAAGPYTLKATSPGGTVTTLLTNSTVTTYAIGTPIGSPYTGNQGTWTFQITNSAGEVLGTTTDFSVVRTGNIFTGYNYYGTC